MFKGNAATQAYYFQTQECYIFKDNTDHIEMVRNRIIIEMCCIIQDTFFHLSEAHRITSRVKQIIFHGIIILYQ